ncbi:MAG: MgtC/SapB family protein [Opitutaceae bacterium]
MTLDSNLLEVFARLGIVLGLGLLVGLQRQRTDARLAGFRTFPLVTLLGALCGLLAQIHGGVILAAGLAAMALVIVGGNLPLFRAGQERPGVTTEVTMLLMFAIGAYAMVGSLAVAIATCGAVAVLLHLKPQMHSMAEKIGDPDFRAMMQFALISLVILPVLPNQVYGPFAVLNPFKIWLMVVLIVGISLLGYVAYKLIGVRAGAWASGVLGGLISSTATTVSVARRSRVAPGKPEVATFVIMMASAVSLLRVGILVGVTAPQFLRAASVPLAAMLAVLAAIAGWSLHRSGSESPALPDQTNPSELKPALVFGLLYALVLLGVAAANEYFGRNGLYVAAVISGLTDMDAITLSVAQLVKSAEIVPGTGWRLILVAAMANLAFKTATVAALGERPLLRRVAFGFGAAAAMGAAMLFYGPA